VSFQARTIDETPPEPTLKDLSNKPGAPSLTSVREDDEATSPAEVKLLGDVCWFSADVCFAACMPVFFTIVKFAWYVL